MGASSRPKRKAEKKEPEPYFVHPKNWTAFEAFAECWTQWEIIQGVNGGRYKGLNYASVWAVIQSMKPKKPGRVFRQVRSIELGALKALNDRQNISDNAGH